MLLLCRSQDVLLLCRSIVGFFVVVKEPLGVAVCERVSWCFCCVGLSIFCWITVCIVV